MLPMGVYREYCSKFEHLYKEKSQLGVDLFCRILLSFCLLCFSKIVKDDYFISLKYLSNVYFAPITFLILFISITT